MMEGGAWAGGAHGGSRFPGTLTGLGSNGFSFSLLQATDNDVGTFGEVNYFFSDDPDR